MTPNEYVLYRNEVNKTISELQYGLFKNKPDSSIPLPTNIRKATKDDIVIDAVIWYKTIPFRNSYWKIIKRAFVDLLINL